MQISKMIAGVLWPSLLLAASAAGQYRIDSWTTENGLPQNSINGIAQTPDGYVWFGTKDGLVRFDGVRFKVFNKSNSDGITNNRVADVRKDNAGRLWVSSEDGSLLFYEHGRFAVVVGPNDPRFAVRGPMVDDGFDAIAFYLPSEKRNYHYANGALIPFEIQGASPDKTVLYHDREGSFWLADRLTFDRIKDARQQTFTTNVSHRATSVLEDSFGSFWLTVDSNKNEIYRIRSDQMQTIEIPTVRTTSIAEDKAGNLWIATFDRGILRLPAEKVNSDDINAKDFEHYTTENGLLSDKPGNIIPDSEGGVWIGTEKGLHRFSPQSVRFFSVRDGLREDNVYPILQDRSGSIWLGAWVTSLIKYRDGVFSTYLSEPTIAYYSSLFEDRDGKLWLGTDGNAFYLENGRPIKFTEAAGFVGGAIFNVISQDRDGGLWFGTDRGLSRYEKGVATVFTNDEGLPDSFVTTVLQSKDGKIWVGTRGGIALADSSNVGAGEWRNICETDGLASNYTRSLYEDAEGSIWIGSYDGGLTRYRDGKLTRFTRNDGLHSDGVFCILEDANGWFWINSNQGIYRIRKQELNDFADGKIKFITSMAYGKQDGLLNIEGNGGRQPAGLRARDGKLWFPMSQGVAVVDPQTVSPNPLPPPVLIEEISIDRKPINNEVFQSTIGPNAVSINLYPNHNNIEIRYTGLSFVNSEQVKFKYRLEGLETDWNEVGTRRSAYYSYLPPGDYNFHVLAANRDGVWNDLGAAFRITVNPAYYQTVWFWALLALATLCIVTLAYRYRLGQLQKINETKTAFARQLIKSQESERKRIASELHDGLGQDLLVIKNRAMIGASASAEVSSKEQFSRIDDSVSKALSEVRTITADLRPLHLERLGLTTTIEEMIGSVAQSSGIDFEFAVAPLEGSLGKDEEMSLYRILQECLNNIVKHSRAAHAVVTIARGGEGIRVTVNDDGVGFDPSDPSTQTGMGLVGLAERVRMLGGIYTIESSPGNGTSVSIVIER